MAEEGKKEIAYHTVFSVKGEWEQAADHNRGWINLAGLRVSVEEGDEDHSTSLRESEKHLHFEGYINIDLDITVNANMLKQPVAKEIRVYVQKLVCSLTGTDAI